MGTATRPLEPKTMKFCTKMTRVNKIPSVWIASTIALEVEFSVTTLRQSPHNAFFVLLTTDLRLYFCTVWLFTAMAGRCK
jgi:hypothetical protein